MNISHKSRVLWDIFKYYLTTTESRRNNYSGPFPNLRPTLDSNQIKVFEYVFPKDVVNLLLDYEENIASLGHMKETIHYKSELETKIKNLHLKPNQEAIGAVALHNKCNISLNKAADLLHVSHDEAVTEKNNLKKIEKPTTKKAKKFLELINK